MPIIVFQHSDIGTPGRLGMTLRDHGYTLDIRRADLPPGPRTKGVPPDLDNVEGVIILGGPANVTDIASLSWMQAEAEFIRAAHKAQLPIIGICLGGQLIAHALGGEVGPREKPAIGFYPARLNTVGQVEPVLAGLPWEHPQYFSCGQEVKKTPPDCSVLAGSETCKVQAYRVGLRTFGFLFHFECDRPLIDALTSASRKELEANGMTPGDVAAQADKNYPAYARLSDRLCVNLAALCFPLPTLRR